ncbi:hypothetical protein NE236_34045 [Actinoallomurus purpureus]|uniref:sialidase family protein n=1 Tax=Actinoallomurus purpureus TaxID=478114 RepID=UPI0020928A68|nr:hypothetical protein [Actinoallomurus purpureus]MCO6010004.1 hypothetical protein [Actinoallomurus purpureus]
MAGQNTPDDDPNTEPPSDDQWSPPPPPPPAPWGPNPAQPPLPPWATPPQPPYGAAPPGLPGSPPYEPVPEGFPASPPQGQQSPSGPPPETPGEPGDGGWQEPPETREWAPEPPVDPWRIPPQPVWDPAVEPPLTWAPPPQVPYGPGGQEPPAPHFPAYDAGGGDQPTSLDLPPSAMVPRSTPRPPGDPEREPRSTGENQSVRFDEPWRTETPGRAGRRVRLRPILIGVAGVLVAGLVAGGVYILTSGGKKEPKTPAAVLAGRMFAADPAAKTDGRDQELLNVAAWGSTVVAIGGEFDTDYRGEFFVSTDGGRSFGLADVHTADGQEPPYGDVPRRIVGAAGAWVALGNSPTGTVVWTSHDGRSWTRQPDDAGSSFNRPDRVGRIVRTSTGFVAVGDTSARGDYSDASPIVWLSPDGRRWDRQPADQLGISAKEGALSLVDAAAVGNTVIAHGWNTVGKSSPSDLTWRSADGGRTWEQVSIPQPKDASGLGITATPSGFVAARNVSGTTGKGDKKKPEFSGVVLSSPDAKQWTQTGSIHVPGYYGLQRIAGSDRGLAALVDTGKKLAVVRSTDGRSWNAAGEVPIVKGQDVQGVAATAGTTIVVGRVSAEDGNDALLQVRDTQGQNVPVNLFGVSGGNQPDRSVSALASGQGTTLAVGSVNGDGAIWRSRDGRTWERASATGQVLARPGRQRLLGAAQGGAGWLAVGYHGLSPKRPLVVTSADGATWQAADGNGVFKPSGDAQLLTSATAVGKAGYVVVGADGPSAATWSSADLKSWSRGSGSGKGDLDGKPEAPRWMADVTAGSFGYVAVGGLNDPTAGTAANGRPVVWTSSDGKTWRLQQLPVPGGTLEATFAHVATANGQLLAAGTARTSSASTVFAYTSSDGGKSWQQLRLPGADGSTGMALTTLTATLKGFVVAAGAGRGGRSDVYLWTMTGGKAWQLDKPQGLGLSGRGDQWLTGLTTSGPDLLAVGVTADHRGEQPILWRRPLP